MTEIKIDEKMMDSVKKNMKDGWIKAWMMIEVMAVDEAVAKSALEKHVEKISKEKQSLLYKIDYKEVKKIENARPNIPTAYSYIVELELVVEKYDKLVYIIMNYAPAAIEILEPDKLTIGAGELQGILVSISDIIHKFAAMGVGGVVVNG